MNSEKQIKECLATIFGDGKIRLVLDAESNDCSQHMSSLQDSVEGAMHDFQYWITEHSLNTNDIWYADLFKIEGPHIQKHIASLFVEPDNVSIRLEPAPEGSTLQPFGRKPELKRRVKNLIEGFRKQWHI